MSPREKKLLTLFVVAALVVVNAVGLSFYRKKSDALEASRLKAEGVLEKYQLFEASRQQRLDEMEWLQRNLPDPAENQNVQTALQAACVSEARGGGLEIRDEDVLPSEMRDGAHFHRARFRLKVTGTEESLYRWLDKINQPNQLRAATHLILSPNKENDTLIDCTATVEQWFVPAGPAV